MNVAYKTKAEAGMSTGIKQSVVDEELKKILKAHGAVTPELILGAARSTKSPLHKYFEWDDSVAAQKYRLDQAYQLLLASKIVVELSESRGTPPKVVTCQHVVRNMIPSFKAEGFRPRETVLSKKDQREAFIEQKKEQLRSWCRGVVDLKEFKKLRELILKEIGE